MIGTDEYPMRSTEDRHSVDGAVFDDDDADVGVSDANTDKP